MLRIIFKAIIRLKDNKEKLPCKMSFYSISLQGNFSLVSNSDDGSVYYPKHVTQNYHYIKRIVSDILFVYLCTFITTELPTKSDHFMFFKECGA